jgi:hypothetical protein
MTLAAFSNKPTHEYMNHMPKNPVKSSPIVYREFFDPAKSDNYYFRVTFIFHQLIEITWERNFVSLSSPLAT